MKNMVMGDFNIGFTHEETITGKKAGQNFT